MRRAHAPMRAAVWVCLAAPWLARAACTLPVSIQARLQAQPSAESHASAGAWFGNQKQFDCAARSYAEAFRAQPQSASYAYLWGTSLYAAGNDNEAVSALRQAQELDPNDVRIHLMLASVLERVKKPAEAVAEWRAALGIDPDSSVALDNLSSDLIAQRDYPSVVALLERRGGNKPGTTLQTLNLGIALAASARLDEAANVLREGLKTAPSELGLMRELVDVLVLLDRNEEAVSVLEPAMEREHVDLETRIVYLRTLLSAQSDKAREVAPALLAAAPQNWEVLYLNGVLESSQEEWPAAREHLQRSVALKSDYANSHGALGTALAKLKDAPDAKKELEQAIALGDRTPEIEYTLGRVLESLGASEEGRARIKASQQLRTSQADRAQGDRALSAGDAVQAAALYREALENDPAEAVLAYKLAKALEKTHDLEGEKAALQRAIALDPKMAEAQNQMGYVLVHSGETTQGEEHFRAAVQASPFYTVAWVNLSAALASEARWEPAREALRHALEIEPENLKARQLGQAIAKAEGRP